MLMGSFLKCVVVWYGVIVVYGRVGTLHEYSSSYYFYSRGLIFFQMHMLITLARDSYMYLFNITTL